MTSIAMMMPMMRTATVGSFILFPGHRREVRSGLGPLLDAAFWHGIRDRSPRRRLRHKQPERIVRHPRLFPREATERHATEDDRQRPDVGWTRIILFQIIHFRGKVGVGTDDPLTKLVGCLLLPLNM